MIRVHRRRTAAQLLATCVAALAALVPYAARAQTPAAPAPAGAPPAVGTRVLAVFRGIRNEATVLAVRSGEVRVRYVTTTGDDEWLPADRIEPFDAGSTRGGPPMGTYQCWMNDPSSGLGSTWVGSFAVGPGGSYRYLTGTKGGGRFRYDERTRTLAFAGGPLASGLRSAEYYNQAPNAPTIVLEFARGRRVGDAQNCLFRGNTPR